MRLSKPTLHRLSELAAFCAVVGLGFFAPETWAATLRVVSYNIDCADQSSDNNITGSTHSLPTVVQAIGLHHIGTNAQQVDVMSVEELTSTTLANFSAALNNIYGAGTYSYDPTTDPNTGGGPDGIIYNTHTVQIVSARALKTGQTVLLQSNGTYTSAHSPGGGINGVTRAPMVYQIRPIGHGTNNDFYMYVSHARSTSDDSVGDARYAEAQAVRSDAKYNLPAGSHILYGGDWNLFNGSGENAYKCLTGQTTSDGINWADTNSSTWANTNQTQGYDPTSKTVPPTTTTWANVSGDNALYLYDDSTSSLTSRIDIQLPNALMFAAYNSAGGVQLASDTSDPFDTSNFPSSQYPYAFEAFGNNGSTPRSSSATSSANHSLDDLNSTTPSASTTKTDILLTGSGSSSTGSDHYPIVGDYNIVTVQAPVASFTASPTNPAAAPLTVTFTDTSTGAITNRLWNFGDGATSNTVTFTTVSHTYTNVGVHTVTLTASGPGGSNTSARTNLINIVTPYQAWQLLYFGCTNCPQSQTNADSDGTGQNNFFKFVAGLNPTNPASVFSFGVATGAGTNQIKLSFSPNVLTRTYTAFDSTNLSRPGWTPIITSPNTRTTNGNVVTITDTPSSATQKFYYIQISGPSL